MDRCGSKWTPEHTGTMMKADRSGVYAETAEQRVPLSAHIYTFSLHALTPFRKTTKATRTAKKSEMHPEPQPPRNIKNKTL